MAALRFFEKEFIDHVDPSSPDPIRLGGVGKFVADSVEKKTGIEARAIVLGHVQRGGTPTTEATQASWMHWASRKPVWWGVRLVL